MKKFRFLSFITGTLVCLVFLGDMTWQKPFLGQEIAQSSGAETSIHNEPQVGDLELVAELEITPGNITVSQDGRIFASVHGLRRGSAQLIEIFPGRDRWRPFPNESWNAEPGSGPNIINTAHGVTIDAQNRLWVIDHGNWMPNQQPVAQPKLVAFDLDSGDLVFRMEFDQAVAPEGQVLQDLAVDDARGFVYLADSGDRNGILIVDINKKQAWRWENHPSLDAEDVDLVVEDRILAFPGPNGSVSPVRIPVNPITLSVDGEVLFYGAMTGETWYQIPAKLLRERASNQAIGKAVAVVGSKPVSDGVSTDAEGNHFITNLRENAIDILSSEGQLSQLIQDDRFLWADNVRFGPGSWLYININQLHRTAVFTGGADADELPYRIFRVWTGTEGQPGR